MRPGQLGRENEIPCQKRLIFTAITGEVNQSGERKWKDHIARLLGQKAGPLAVCEFRYVVLAKVVEEATRQVPGR